MTAQVNRRNGSGTVVALTGEIDVGSAEELRDVLIGLADGGHSDIVVDFDGVEFCDATGLGVLVSADNRVRKSGGRLRLARVKPPQRKILDLTRLDRLLV